MAEPATRKKTSSSMMPDWSLLPEDLLHFISTHLDNCFDVIHARSVCRQWRSTFPFPSCLLRSTYSLPSFAELDQNFQYLSEFEKRKQITVERIPLFLFRVRNPPAAVAASASDYLFGAIRRAELKDHMKLPSPLQCSVKVIDIFYRTLINILDCQILPLGHQHRVIGWLPTRWSTGYEGVTFLPLNNEGGAAGGEFVVLVNYGEKILVLRSSDMRWVQLEKTSRHYCKDIVTFRGRFYALFVNGDVFVIDPYSLEATPIIETQLMTNSWSRGPQYYLVPSGNHEIFLVKIRFHDELVLRVRRLDEEAGKWIEASHLGDLILFIGEKGNFSCSAKDIPDGCGLSRNSVLFTAKHRVKVFTSSSWVNAGTVIKNCVTLISSVYALVLRVEH